ncbi:hypothetical protein PFISCL1PPCAC_4915, partial [Pristionchus fissidentatus]
QIPNSALTREEIEVDEHSHEKCPPAICGDSDNSSGASVLRSSRNSDVCDGHAGRRPPSRTRSSYIYPRRIASTLQSNRRHRSHQKLSRVSED